MRRIVIKGSIREHFAEALQAALEHHRPFAAQPETLAYLLELLCDYAQHPATELQRPLAFELAAQAHALPDEAVIRLKRLGDNALYLCGFFRESLQRGTVGVDYYCEMGGRAYRRLGGLIRRRDKAPRLVGVYVELADHFAVFSDLLSDVHLQAMPDDDLGNLYEAWLRTQSRALEQKLRARGVAGLNSSKGQCN